MGNAYTPQSIANYNLNPPADDGSEVPSNQLTWAKHKQKLGDPIKTLAEAIDTQNATAFGKVQGGITSVVDDYTALASDQGKLIVQTGSAKTITTPAAATVTMPFRFGILNAHATSDVTIDGNASETIDGSATVTVPPGKGIVIETDGTNWFTHGLNWIEAGLTLTEGDLLYVDANGHVVNLGIGTALQQLRTNAGTTAPEWFTPATVAPGVWTLIDETVIASIQASHGVGSLTAYRELWVEFENVLPASPNGNWLIRTDSGGADVGDSGASDYSYTRESTHAGGGGNNDASQSANGIPISGSAATDQPATTAPGLYGSLHFFDFNEAVEAVCTWQVAYQDESVANGLVRVGGTGMRLDSTAKDFIQLIHSAGNIASGTIRIWGK